MIRTAAEKSKSNLQTRTTKKRVETKISPHQLQHLLRQEKYEAHTETSIVASSLSSCQLLQTSNIPIEYICIPAICVSVRILPNSLIRPSTRNRPNGATVARQNQWACGMEGCAPTRACAPPVIGAVDHGVASRLGVVCIDKILDPRNHRSLTQAVAGRAGRVVLDV